MSRQKLKSQFLGARSVSDNVIETPYVCPPFSLNNPKLRQRICAENGEMKGLFQHSARFSRLPNIDCAFFEFFGVTPALTAARMPDEPNWLATR
jgi:hypothetical protein